MRWTTIAVYVAAALAAAFIVLMAMRVESDKETIRRNLEQSRELNNESLKNIERRGF